MDPLMGSQLIGGRGLDAPAHRAVLRWGLGLRRGEEGALGLGCDDRRARDLGRLPGGQAPIAERLCRRRQRLQLLRGGQCRRRGSEPFARCVREIVRGAAVPALAPDARLVDAAREAALRGRARVPGARHAPQHPDRVGAAELAWLEACQCGFQGLAPLADLVEHAPITSSGYDIYEVGRPDFLEIRFATIFGPRRSGGIGRRASLRG